MSIYVSKRGLSKYPQNPVSALSDDPFGGPFISPLLNENAYLKGIYSNSMGFENLSVYSITDDSEKVEAISIVKTLMIFIAFSQSSCTQPFNLLNTAIDDYPKLIDFLKDHRFDNKFEAFIASYKTAFSLPGDPVIDQAFLKHLDETASCAIERVAFNVEHSEENEGAFAYRKFNYVGYGPQDSKVEIEGVLNAVTGLYKYTIIVDKDEYDIEISQSNTTQNKIISPSESILPSIPVGAPNKTVMLETNEGWVLKKIVEEINLLNLPAFNQTQNFIEFAPTHNEQLIDIAPSQIRGSIGRHDYYTIQPGDKMSDIIGQYYYGFAEDLIDEDGNTIYTFPNRTMPQGLDRNNDPRFKFYKNHLYYYNTSYENSAYVENGISIPSNAHLTDNQLDDYYNFETPIDNNDSQSYLLNTERFINYKTNINSNSEVVYDAQGDENHYTLTPGKTIMVPKRKIADSFYNHLNFRPESMLSLVGNAFLYPTVAAFDTWLGIMDSSLNALQDFNQAAIDVLKQAYKDIVDFHRAVYNYAINVLADYWPRGIGGYIGGELGVTWGIPLGTDVSMKKTIYRKLTNHDELVLVLASEGGMKIGLDAGVGVNLGLKSGSGRKKKTIGIGVGAGVQAGLNLTLSTEYEFPIRPEESGLISLLAASIGTAGLVASSIIDSLLDTNINPLQYLTKGEFNVNNFVSGYAGAQVGAGDSNSANDFDQKNKIVKYKPNQTANGNKSKSWMDQESIWNNIVSGIGIYGTAEFALGFSMSYKAEYDNKPLDLTIDARVPSSVETRNKFYARGELNIGPMGNLLQRFLVGSTVGLFLSALNFDKGISFTLYNKVTRPGSVSNFSKSQINVSGGSLPIHNSNGNIKYTGKNVESGIQLGITSGDYEAFCLAGTISYLKLDTYKLATTNFNGFVWTDFDAIISLFSAFGIKHKLGYNYNSRSRKKLARSIMDNTLGLDNTLTGPKNTLIKRAQKSKFGVEAGLCLAVELEFDMQPFAAMLKYFYQRLLIQIDKTKDYIKDSMEHFINAENFYNPPVYSSNAITVNQNKYNDLLTEMSASSYNTEIVNADAAKSKKAMSRFCGMIYEADDRMTRDQNVNNLSLSSVNQKAMHYANTGADQIIDELAKAVAANSINVSVEGQLGLSVGVNAAVAAGEGKIRLMLGITAGLMMNFEILKDSQSPITDPTDPFYIDLGIMKREILDIERGLQQIIADWIK